MKGAAAGTVKRSDAISLIRINFSRVPQRQGVLAKKGGVPRGNAGCTFARCAREKTWPVLDVAGGGDVDPKTLHVVPAIKRRGDNPLQWIDAFP